MARLSNVFRPEELRYVIIERRQLLVNLGESNLVILMDLTAKGLCIDSPQIRGLELEEFSRKFNLLDEEELQQCLKIDSETFMNVLNQCVSCLGCRRRVERLYKQLSESGHPVLDPLIISQNSAHLTIAAERMKTPQSLGTLLYRHHEVLNNLMENKLRNKTRCVQHSMEMFRSKPFSEIWRDAWSSMNRMCRDEFAVIETQELYAVLQNYLKRHKFCTGCRTKIDKAYKILVGETRTKEKGYVASLYANIKKCYPDKHIHLATNKVEFFDALIRRAEPEIIGSMTKARERHAKTMEVAQEEVLTCIGMILYERLRQAYICMREEERACQLLAAVGIHALYCNFDHYVEKKQGMSNLELLYQEMSRAEKAKELKRELRKLKKKQKKNERKGRLNARDESEENNNNNNNNNNEEKEEEVNNDAEGDSLENGVEQNIKNAEDEEGQEEDEANDGDRRCEKEMTSDRCEKEPADDLEEDEEDNEGVLQQALCRISPQQQEALEAPMIVVRHKKNKQRNNPKQKRQKSQTTGQKKTAATISSSASSASLSRIIQQKLPTNEKQDRRETAKTKSEQQQLSTKSTVKQSSTRNSNNINGMSYGAEKSKASSKNIVDYPASQSAKCNVCESLSLLHCRCENDVKDSGYGSEPSASQTNSLNSSGLCSPEGSEISCSDGYCNHQHHQDEQEREDDEVEDDEPNVMTEEEDDQQEDLQQQVKGSTVMNRKINHICNGDDISIDIDDDQGREASPDRVEDGNAYDHRLTMMESDENQLLENIVVDSMVGSLMTTNFRRENNENIQENDNNQVERLMINLQHENDVDLSRKYALDDVHYISLEQMLMDMNVDESYDNSAYIPPEVVQQYQLHREEVQRRRHLLRLSLRENFLKMCSSQKEKSTSAINRRH